MAKARRSLWLRELLQMVNFLGRGSPHAAETAVVREKTGVAITGALGLAERGAAHVGAGFPRTAAHHPLHVFGRIRRAGWISARTFFVVSRAVNILAPLGDISVEIKDPPAIR